MLINGVASDQVSIDDRGLLYGDGVFRTMRLQEGQVQQWPRHYRKLQQDCDALGIACPQAVLLQDELQHLSRHQMDGIAKIIITRGVQQKRGYPPTHNHVPTRILILFPAPDTPSHFATLGIRLRVCELRLSHQPRLAGIKHLNRLENVLAAAEWDDPEIAEGLLLDTAGNVIGGTRSNLFIVHGGELHTADLTRCGVAGVQRERVIEWAVNNNVQCHIGHYKLADVLGADELFVVNSVIGLWPVRELQDLTWNQYPISLQVQKWLNG